MKSLIILLLASASIANAVVTTSVQTTSITASSATVEVQLGNSTTADWIDVWVEWGTAPTALNQTVHLNAGGTDGDFSSLDNSTAYFDSVLADWTFEPQVSFSLTGLSEGTTYYFRDAIFFSGAGTTQFGTTQSFTAAVPEPKAMACIFGALALLAAFIRQRLIV